MIINCNLKEIICYFLREEAEKSLAVVNSESSSRGYQLGSVLNLEDVEIVILLSLLNTGSLAVLVLLFIVLIMVFLLLFS